MASVLTYEVTEAAALRPWKFQFDLQPPKSIPGVIKAADSEPDLSFDLQGRQGCGLAASKNQIAPPKSVAGCKLGPPIPNLASRLCGLGPLKFKLHRYLGQSSPLSPNMASILTTKAIKAVSHSFNSLAF